MEFYAHSEKDDLIKHSIEVAQKAKELTANILNFNTKAAFLAGLFHDLGKLNPYYQIIFNNPVFTNAKAGNYAAIHSRFSARIFYSCYYPNSQQDVDLRFSVYFAIEGHHTKLINFDKSLQINQEKYNNSLEFINENLSSFLSSLSEKIDDKALVSEIRTDGKIREGSFPTSNGSNFFDACVVYSALLQADRGYFESDWKKPRISDVEINTEKLKKNYENASSQRIRTLNQLRDEFQKKSLNLYFEALLKNRFVIIEAPTGIGKTKLFLDIIKELKNNLKNIERIIYFSPLLALTDDFLGKFTEVIKSNHRIISYTSIEQGQTEEDTKTEEEKKEYSELNQSRNEAWNFLIESFNYNLIVTTTQRLLITLFSNNYKDKLKFLSLANSVLIVDEIQMVPPELLKATVDLLNEFVHRGNSYVLLVSATMPVQLKKANSNNNGNIIRPLNETIQSYNSLLELYKTIKFIMLNNYSDLLEQVRKNSANTLIMFNTRKAAYNFAKACSNGFVYITDGIRYGDRIDREKAIKNSKDGKEGPIVISTQVLEAGIDISFKTIYRELAPLDSIIQVLGRLNRSLEYDKGESALTIFARARENKQQDINPNEYLPYNSIEIRESWNVIKKLSENFSKKEISFKKLLGELENYYSNVFENNATLRRRIETFGKNLSGLKFEEVDKFYREVLRGENKITIYVPEDEEQLKEIKKELTELINLKAEAKGDSNKLRDIRKMQREAYEKLNKTGVTVSSKIFNILKSKEKIEEVPGFNNSSTGIYLPKEGEIKNIYDENFGIDRCFEWLN
ncbi:MAG: CRISPR-associated helicase Cas3' [Candidatus Micrarchaeaceae archaeon]